MRTLFHLKDATKQLKTTNFSKRDLSYLLLDLFYADTKRMGKRAKITILDHDEHINYYPDAIICKPLNLDNYKRTLYVRHQYATICEYKERRNTHDKN